MSEEESSLEASKTLKSLNRFRMLADAYQDLYEYRKDEDNSCKYYQIAQTLSNLFALCDENSQDELEDIIGGRIDELIEEKKIADDKGEIERQIVAFMEVLEFIRECEREPKREDWLRTQLAQYEKEDETLQDLATFSRQVGGVMKSTSKAEKGDNLEVQVEELADLINKEGAKVYMGSLPKENWKMAGMPEEAASDGSSGWVEGKTIKHLKRSDGSFTTNKATAGVLMSPYTNTMTCPKPDINAYFFLTYVVKPLQGERMEDVVDEGGNEDAYTISFERRGICFDGRPTDPVLTVIVPKDIAIKVSALIKKDKKAAVLLFDKILPSWVTTNGVTTFPNIEKIEYLDGELLPN